MGNENDKKTYKNAINESEYKADRIPTHRLEAYYKDRPKLTLKSKQVKDWSAQNEK